MLLPEICSKHLSAVYIAFIQRMVVNLENLFLILFLKWNKKYYTKYQIYAIIKLLGIIGNIKSLMIVMFWAEKHIIYKDFQKGLSLNRYTFIVFCKKVIFKKIYIYYQKIEREKNEYWK